MLAAVRLCDGRLGDRPVPNEVRFRGLTQPAEFKVYKAERRLGVISDREETHVFGLAVPCAAGPSLLLVALLTIGGGVAADSVNTGCHRQLVFAVVTADGQRLTASAILKTTIYSWRSAAEVEI